MNPESLNPVPTSSQVARRLICGRSSSELSTESFTSVESFASSISSPVTNLTFNLQVLSTHGKETKVARRKLSLNTLTFTSESPGFVCSSKLQRQFSADDGCCVDSPDSDDSHDAVAYDSPFLDNWTEPFEAKNQCRASFKRFSSVQTFSTSKLSSLSTSTKEIRPSRCCSETESFVTGDENKENENFETRIDCKKSVSFKLPMSPAPRGIVSPFKDETNMQSCGKQALHQGNSKDQCNQDQLYKSPKTPAKAYGRQPQRTLSRKLSNDDGFLEKLQVEEVLDQLSVPKGLEGLFFSPVIEANECEMSPMACEQPKPLPRSQAKTDDAEENSPALARGLFCVPNGPRPIRRKYSAQDIRISYKRSESQTQDSELTPLQLKRWKGLTKERDASKNTNDTAAEKRVTPRRIMRCHSETEIFIKNALSWADSQQDLIGDFSKPFCLPLISGKHQDLKAISPETMAALVSNAYKEVVESCIVIDCRYPYEFEGGHIQGAKNIYTAEDLASEFFTGKDSCATSSFASFSSPFAASPSSSAASEKRTVIVFHCEFSSERGPKLSRFLRSHDRDHNINSYPALHYPELYLLEGGYKAFYESFPHLCEPNNYVPMVHPDHLPELKVYRSRASTLSTNEKARAVGRSAVSRPSLIL